MVIRCYDNDDVAVKIMIVKMMMEEDEFGNFHINFFFKKSELTLQQKCGEATSF